MGSKVEHPFKVEVWEGDKVHETMAVVNHATVAIAAYEAAVQARQGRVVTLRHGARVLRSTEPASCARRSPPSRRRRQRWGTCAP
jgi:hypothetical protein